MSRSKAVRAALILLFGFGVLVAAQPFGASDAEAKRGFGRASLAGARVINRSTEKKEDGEEANQSEEDGDEEASKSSEAGTDGTAAVATEKAAVVTPATTPAAAPAVVLKPLDLDVPGCATGMMCTVCVAGCNGPTNGIVHATPKLQR